MATGSRQLADDYDQLRELLEIYPHITIVKTEGQPPDNYEIEYALRGYAKDADDAVVIADRHRIRIILPFGYPHFAPTVKPLTAIFHPDIDPAAVRIADRWQQNPSLPELVLYIGEMICGSVYNLEDPFSQDAADWYRAHQSALPLDSLSIADIEEPDARLDSLVDDTFASLGLESDDFLEPAKKHATSDIQHIRDLMAEKHFFAANKLLGDLPGSVEIPDREEMQQQIGRVLRKTDQLHKLAEQLEDMGKIDEALEVVNNLFDMVADSPGADALRTRIQQAFQIAQSLDRGPEIREPLASTSKKSEDKTVKTPNLPPRPAKAKEVQPRARMRIPIQLILVIIVALGLCVGAISLFFQDQNALSLSQANLLKSQLQIDKKQFDNAQESLEAAKKAIADLTLLRFRKTAIEKEINTLLTSRDLQEGLKGRVLFEGEYIPAATATFLGDLAVLTDQAKTLAGQNKLAEALTIYRQALKFAEKHDLAQRQTALKEEIKTLELQHALVLAEKAEQGKNWKEAVETYKRALKLSGNLADLGTASDITNRLTAATFRHELDQSKKAFTQSQWHETIAFLEQAQQAINANPEVVSEKERQDLHRLLVNAQLYQTLSLAREAYEQKNWGQAISGYEQALTLLAREKGNIDDNLDTSIAKIEKTLLLVRIAQVQDKVLLAEGKNDLAGMVTHSKEILKMAQSSKFGADAAVKALTAKVSEQIEKNQQQLSLNEKIAWLEEHAEEIFRANYPTFKGSKLVQPKAAFLKKIDNKSIFTLSCIERSQGSSSKLELNYMFDADTGKWSNWNDQ